MDPQFPGTVYGGFGDFSGQIGIHPQRRRPVDKPLRRTGTPTDGFDRVIATADQQRLPAQCRRYPPAECLRRQGLAQAPDTAHRQRIVRLQATRGLNIQ